MEEGGLLLFDPVGPLAAGEDGGVEGQVTQQVERVGIRLARLGRDGCEIYTAVGQLLDDFGALAGSAQRARRSSSRCRASGLSLLCSR